MKRRYVPCMRWKQGEYQAVMKLTNIAKESILPLIEIPERSYDFETKQFSQTLVDVVKPFAKRVKQKWGQRLCMIDAKHILAEQELQLGRVSLENIFKELDGLNCVVAPVVCSQFSSFNKMDMLKYTINSSNDIAYRATLIECLKPNFPSILKAILDYYKKSFNQSHLIIDLGAPELFKDYTVLANYTFNAITNIPFRNDLASITALSSSFPKTMGQVQKGNTVLERYEWLFYKVLATLLKTSNNEVCQFGDYCINYPEPEHVDMRLVKPSASLRYTITDSWYIAKGLNVRDNGYAQYQELCKTIIGSGYFRGEKFSHGDEYIHLCSIKKVGTGNLTTWRKVGTNQHIHKVIYDLANFHV